MAYFNRQHFFFFFFAAVTLKNATAKKKNPRQRDKERRKKNDRIVSRPNEYWCGDSNLCYFLHFYFIFMAVALLLNNISFKQLRKCPSMSHNSSYFWFVCVHVYAFCLRQLHFTRFY